MQGTKNNDAMHGPTLFSLVRRVTTRHALPGSATDQYFAGALLRIHSSIDLTASPMFPIWQWFWADSTFVNTLSVNECACERSCT